MIIKIFKSRLRSGKACIDYFLGSKRQREGAYVLYGNPDVTQAIIDNCKFKKKYTSGCLSIVEKDVSDNAISKIINLFQVIILSGLSPNQVNFLWVIHKDKFNLELNFVIPSVCLVTGRNIDYINMRMDLYLLNGFRDFADLKYDLQSPLNPNSIRLMILPKSHSIIVKGEIGVAIEPIVKLIESNKIIDRAGLINHFYWSGFDHFKSYSGSISFTNNNDDKVYNFSGLIFREDFSFSRDFHKKIMADSVLFDQSADNRFAVALKQLHDAIQFRNKRMLRYALSFDYLCQLRDRAILLVENFQESISFKTQADNEPINIIEVISSDFPSRLEEIITDDEVPDDNIGETDDDNDFSP